ncbi:MAG: HD domain-containing protein, partial [Nitrospirota bacterium]
IDGATVQRVTSEDKEKYEISMPIRFSSKFLGSIHIDMSTGSIDAAQSAAARNIIIVSVLVLSLGAFGVFILSRFITVPIELLTQGVSKLAAEKYDGEIRIMSDDEIGRLTRNFNRMAKLITEQKGKLRHHAKELEEAYIATIKVLAAAIDARDPHTLGHSARVSRLSRLLGERIGLGYEELKELEMACLLHDVGKIRTPDSILHKEDRLDRDEYSLMMEHTNDGADILGLVDSLKALIPAVKHHHEWYDGSGYPDGLKGNDIPLYAAILAITDAYDAMMSTRPYKGPRSHHEAINELIEYKGAQFDPKLTDLFIDIVMDEVRNEEAARLGFE